jgi:hypothetical protein
VTRGVCRQYRHLGPPACCMGQKGAGSSSPTLDLRVVDVAEIAARQHHPWRDSHSQVAVRPHRVVDVVTMRAAGDRLVDLSVADLVSSRIRFQLETAESCISTWIRAIRQSECDGSPGQSAPRRASSSRPRLLDWHLVQHRRRRRLPYLWLKDLPSALGDAIYTDDEVDFIERAGMGDCESKRAWFPRSQSPPSEGFIQH